MLLANVCHNYCDSFALFLASGMSVSNLAIGYDHHSYSSFSIFVFTKFEKWLFQSSCIQARNHRNINCYNFHMYQRWTLHKEQEKCVQCLYLFLVMFLLLQTALHTTHSCVLTLDSDQDSDLGWYQALHPKLQFMVYLC